MSNNDLVSKLKNFFVSTYPEIKIQIEDYNKDPNVKAIYFIDEKFKDLYPYQRKHHLKNSIPQFFYEHDLKNSLCVGLAPEENLADLKYPNEELINDIKPVIMRVLNQVNFFNLLDYAMCPKKSFGEPKRCNGDFSIAKLILEGLEFNKRDLFDIFHVLMFQKCFCDCEILCKFLKKDDSIEKCWKNKK